MTQPFAGGQTRDYTWRQTADEARRMAADLAAQDRPPGSRIGILGKNSAGWIMADPAIWMAGHVSVPLYPMPAAGNIRQIADHSGLVACFIGKLDGLTPAIVRLALPLAPASGDQAGRSSPAASDGNCRTLAATATAQWRYAGSPGWKPSGAR